MLDPIAPERCRTILVADRSFSVPFHIYRVAHKRSLAWQVRWQTSSKMFSDGVHGGIDASLDAATRHLASIWKPIPKRTGEIQPRRTATPGITLISKYRRGRTGPPEDPSHEHHWYLEVALPPRLGRRRQRFYIGTSETVTWRRFRRTLKEAKAYRTSMIKAAGPAIRT